MQNIEFEIRYRKAILSDITTYFNWANDDEVRQNALNSNKISWNEHVSWFEKKILSEKTLMLFFYTKSNQQPIGQVRFDIIKNISFIDISIDKNQRGKNYSKLILLMAIKEFKKYHSCEIRSYVKEKNFASINLFKKSNFEIIEVVEDIIYFKLNDNKKI